MSFNSVNGANNENTQILSLASRLELNWGNRKAVIISSGSLILAGVAALATLALAAFHFPPVALAIAGAVAAVALAIFLISILASPQKFSPSSNFPSVDLIPPQSIHSETAISAEKSLGSGNLGQSAVAPISIGKEREMRIQYQPGQITNKLQKQFELAQRQAAQEVDKAFVYRSANDYPTLESHTETVAGYEVGVCHCIGRRREMEDEHLTTAFSLTANGTNYPVQLFGIFDGHGGSEAAKFVKQNLERVLQQTLNEFCTSGLTDDSIWKALKITFVRLNKEFQHPTAGTTATVALILNEKIWTANIGDSRTILDTGIQLSEDAKPEDPRYKKGIEKRDGVVYRAWDGAHRIDGYLAVARAVGDHNVNGISARPKITAYPLSQVSNGSHLILSCDGIYEVASTRQIATAVSSHKDQSSVDLAKNIIYSAWKSGSGDNLSTLVVKLTQ